MLRGPLIVSSLHMQRISRFSDSRVLCCHLVEIEDVMTLRSRLPLDIYGLLKMVFDCLWVVVDVLEVVVDGCRSFLPLVTKGEQLRQRNFGREVWGFCSCFKHKF